jgi:Na+/proline symporter
VGVLAGAGGAAIYAVPRYLATPRPSDGILDLLSVAEFAFTGALIGALVGALWNRRAGTGIAFGLVAGAIIELLVIASGWSVDSTAERVLKVGLDAFVIVGLVAAALPLRERQSSPTAASASPRVA